MPENLEQTEEVENAVSPESEAEQESVESADAEPTEENAEPPEAAAEENADGEEGESESSEESEEVTDENGEPKDKKAAFKPKVKFSVRDPQNLDLQKEVDIPKEFHSLMKDEKSQKMVHDLFEKAHGIEAIKADRTVVKAERDKYRDENRGLHGALGKARNIYQSAVETGNLHKLDGLLQMFQIPEKVMMEWAIEKAKLQSMEPEQRNVVESRIKAERAAELEKESNDSLKSDVEAQKTAMKKMEFEMTMNSPVATTLDQELEAKFGQPGLFKKEVVSAGQIAWLNGKDISVAEAVESVKKKYALTGKFSPASPKSPNGGQGNGSAQNGTKKVVKRTASTLPNINGANGASPLKSSKPQSVDDLKKLRDRAAAGEAV